MWSLYGDHTCGRFWVFQERKNERTGRREYRHFLVPCGKSSCPACRKRKKIRLERRLLGVDWPGEVYMWTITTDPSRIDPEEALATINKRWNNVNREVSRMVEGWRYFKVVELSPQNHLPHIHLLTDCFVDWSEFQRHLIRNGFGKVLHFKKIPVRQAIRYVVKYLAKALDRDEWPYEAPRNLYTSSRGLLPPWIEVRPSDGLGDWITVFVSDDELLVERMCEHARQAAGGGGGGGPPPGQEEVEDDFDWGD